MSDVWFARFVAILTCYDFFLLSYAQEAGSVTFPSIQENRTVRNEQQTPFAMVNKKNDWWPPVGLPLSDQEVTHNTAYQYSPWMQQPPISANYYMPGPPLAAPMSQVRSEHYAYPPEYAEYGHSSPIVSHQVSGNSLGIGSKHLAIVSFIGLLLLFAVIQNSLMSAKRKDALVDALTGRKKRDIFVTHGLRPMTPEQEDILNDDAKLRCIQRTLCLENYRLVKNLGLAGTELAKYLTNGVKKSVRASAGWDRLVEDAGDAGLRGENCNVLYRDCTMAPVIISRFRGNVRDKKIEQTTSDTASQGGMNNI